MARPTTRREPNISELKGGLPAIKIFDKDVVRFDIAMDGVMVMDPLHCRRELLAEFQDLLHALQSGDAAHIAAVPRHSDLRSGNIERQHVKCNDIWTGKPAARGPCCFCRKPLNKYQVGKWEGATGDVGLWPKSEENLRNLASGEGFSDYFRNMFNGNEEAYLR